MSISELLKERDNLKIKLSSNELGLIERTNLEVALFALQDLIIYLLEKKVA